MVINFYQNGRGVGPDQVLHIIANNSTTTWVGKYHSGSVQGWVVNARLTCFCCVAKYKVDLMS
ncbi:MAG: hypothetical protein CM15mV20_0080 [uncultured marine virus]|nr:MAG: hypothetical protein CM15mV20_0080 [uncultured marine virus]